MADDGVAVTLTVAGHGLRPVLVKVSIAVDPADENMNAEILAFLAEVLGVPKSRVEIVAGENGRDKLVSILDMDVETAHQRITARIE